ncbi:hypothetical protein B0H10DRAFT_1278117 [Mycena sp. CBHHK59/15]|nr:hypothetical protein B0H10DRAFT_1278117 [Mycena sp. CBHHK59/15]
MAPLNPIWELFIPDKHLYKQDRHHKGAWCKACVAVCEAQMRQEEIQSIACGADLPPFKTEEQWRALVLASNRVNLMCGKTETMRTHVMKYCEAIRSQPEKISQRDAVIVRARADAATQSAKRSRASSIIL